MDRQTIEFLVMKQNKVVTHIGRSTILQPRTNFKRVSTIKWFDDNKVLKTNKA